MDHTTVVLFIMATAFLVFVGLIYSDIIKIRAQIDTIHQLDMKLIQKLHDSRCTMDQGWKTAIEGWEETLASWQNTVEVNSDILEELKKAIERIE